MSITSEPVLGRAVMRALANRPGGRATVRQLVDSVPQYVNLSDDDHAPSVTRNGEELWEQRVRNLKSHDKAEGNVVREGYVARVGRGLYQLTQTGRKSLESDAR